MLELQENLDFETAAARLEDYLNVKRGALNRVLKAWRVSGIKTEGDIWSIEEVEKDEVVLKRRRS